MLKFVKRINEDHQRSKSLNPPILGKELVFFFYVKITMIYGFFFAKIRHFSLFFVTIRV